MTIDNPRDDDGKIGPDDLDVLSRKRGSRRAHRPDPPTDLAKAQPAMLARAAKLRHPVGIIIDKSEKGRKVYAAPHNDDDLWHDSLADAFGTRSPAVVRTFIRQLEALCDTRPDPDDNPEHYPCRVWADETQFAAVLQIVNGAKPRNELEAAQVAQMVAVHLLTMKVGAYAIAHPYDIKTALSVAKLANAFTLQTQSLRAMQGKQRTARQSIKVKREEHQHIHYHQHGGSEANGTQSHDRTGKSPGCKNADGRSLVRCEDASGVVVPLSSDARKEAVLPPRRKVGGAERPA